jgi:adenosylcobyric acid synthase
MLPRIANTDDLDPLRLEPGVSVVLVKPGEPLPVADLVLLPGSKATISDLAFFRAQGWDIDIAAHVRRGGRVLGLCGGYQMLGRSIADPEGVEGAPGTMPGLGLLDVETVLAGDKRVALVTAMHLPTGLGVGGYQIHLGCTVGPDRMRPLLDLGGRTDGAVSPDGRIMGSYVHGMFASDGFRRAFLAGLGVSASGLSFEARIEAVLDGLADHLERYVEVTALFEIARNAPSIMIGEKAADLVRAAV